MSNQKRYEELRAKKEKEKKQELEKKIQKQTRLTKPQDPWVLHKAKCIGCSAQPFYYHSGDPFDFTPVCWIQHMLQWHQVDGVPLKDMELHSSYWGVQDLCDCDY